MEEFVELVTRVHGMQLLGGVTEIGEGTVNEVRAVYSRLHELDVPAGAEDMHLSYIIYVSLLEEKCLCHIFAQIHSADAQGQHYRECEDRATTAAMDMMSNRFLPSRDTFLQRYDLSASDVGFPY